MVAVTFDYGQTLAELDTVFLSQKLEERGARVVAARLDEECPAAWVAYNDAKRRGEAGYDAWRSFMAALLTRAEARSVDHPDTDMTSQWVDYLWSEQPRRNLWRRPIPGMIELVRDLSLRGVPLGIISNSEGRLAELVEEMGLRSYFATVADSGKLGFEKPDRRIFDVTADALSVPVADLIHVGDAWAADVEGALGVGARAIWITAEKPETALPAGVVACKTATDVRSALRAWDVPA